MSRTGSRTTGRPTLAEVARLSGVSPITASRALRGVSTVAPDLVEKVIAAAANLGYVANPAARALASARSQSVVVLIPSLSNQLFIDTLEAIHEVMRPRGLEVLIGNYHYDLAEEENLIRNYLAYQPCGMLLTGFERSDASRQMLAASGVPCVHMMELGGEAGALSVGFSQQQAGRAAAKHLISDAPGLHLWGTEAEEVLRLPGADRDLGMGLSEAMVRFAARQEWALTVEDMLARRWRALFLDARQAARMAPAVAALLQEETGLDPQLGQFLELCQRYTLAD